MPTFISKPKRFTANQWHESQAHLVPGECRCADRTVPHTHALIGIILLSDGDWIVVEVEGKCHYTLPNSIVQESWERVPNPDDFEYECDGTNCPPRAHDHKVLI